MTVSHSVAPPPAVNKPPVADAGPDQTVASGATVTLDGSGSRDDDGTITHAWERTDGTSTASVPLSSATAIKPTFTADTLAAGAADVTHIFTLTVTDDDDATDKDTVTVTVLAPLAAEAGPDKTVAAGEMVQLEGSGTASDSNRTVTYLWTRIGGDGDDTVAPSDPTALQPTVTAEMLSPGDVDVTHIFTLTVMDDQSSTPKTDTVEITVVSDFADPVADAGPDQPAIASGATVTLDGSGSKPDFRRTLAYSWARMGGTGGSVTLTGATTERPTFVAETLTACDADATYVFMLTVTDSAGDTDNATVTITVEAPKVYRVANAGRDQEVDSGALVTLDGSASSDCDDDIFLVSHAWARTGGTPGGSATLSSTSAIKPTFTADTLAAGAADVTHIFTLTVTDNEGLIDTDTVTITVKAPDAVTNAPPVANAGPDQRVGSGTPVTLNGSGSSDSDGTITYAWARTGGTGGEVTLSNASAARPTFTADTLAPGDPDVTHVFSLTVTDDDGARATDSVTITVTTVLVDILLETSKLTVQEGGTGIYRVRLSRSPRQ